MDKNNIVWIEGDKLQPSQFYINEDSLEILRNNFDSRLFEPVPVKIMGQDIVMTDGHTRTCYLIEKGFDYIPTIEEKDELDWEAYSINVHDCKEKGITSALDLVRCIVPNEVFQSKWNKYCDYVHDKLSYQRNPCDYSALPYWKEITFHIDIPNLSKGYKFRTFNPDSEKDYDVALKIIELSYSNIDITKETLKGYLKSEVYEKNLWVFIDEINNEENISVAFGMADLDLYMKEGILE